MHMETPTRVTLGGGPATTMATVTKRDRTVRENGVLAKNRAARFVLRTWGPGSRRGTAAAASARPAFAPPPLAGCTVRPGFRAAGAGAGAGVCYGVRSAGRIGTFVTVGSHLRLFWTSNMSRP
jgi:hypothetical protein